MFLEQRRVIQSIRFDTWHVRSNKSIRLDVNFAEVEFKDRRDFDRMRLYYGSTIAVPHLEHTYIDPVLGPTDNFANNSPSAARTHFYIIQQQKIMCVN